MSNLFRRQRAKELQMLNQLLQSSKTCKNADILSGVASQCHNHMPAGPNSWGYDLVGLRFEVEKPQSTFPADVGKILSVEIDLTVEGLCVDDEADVFKKLILDITISCTSIEHEKICTWHYDRHIEGDKESSYSHPLYHIQHGGKGMESIADKLGDVLLLAAPRIPFAPMDALLAVDFILSNFAGEEWQNLRDDGTYRVWIGEAQKRYWMPYVKKLMSFWEVGVGSDSKENIRRFWPNLIH